MFTFEVPSIHSMSMITLQNWINHQCNKTASAENVSKSPRWAKPHRNVTFYITFRDDWRFGVTWMSLVYISVRAKSNSTNTTWALTIPKWLILLPISIQLPVFRTFRKPKLIRLKKKHYSIKLRVNVYTRKKKWIVITSENRMTRK